MWYSNEKCAFLSAEARRQLQAHQGVCLHLHWRCSFSLFPWFLPALVRLVVALVPEAVLAARVRTRSPVPSRFTPRRPSGGAEVVLPGLRDSPFASCPLGLMLNPVTPPSLGPDGWLPLIPGAFKN